MRRQDGAPVTGVFPVDGPLHLLGIGLQAIQLSPISHGPLGASLHTPGHNHRFTAMPLFPYAFRLRVRHQAQEHTSEFLPAEPGIRQDASRRTMLWSLNTLSSRGKPSDSRTFLRVPPDCTGNTTERLAAQFHLIARISRHAVPDAWARLPVFCHAIFPIILSDSG
jgi:hypothetical protein